MELQVEVREKFGKSVRALRKQGFIPAEVYGHGTGNVHVSVGDKDFARVWKAAGESTVIELVVGGKKHLVLIHEVQRDYISDSVVHVDFQEVKMDEKLKVHVQLVFTGEPPALKLGGVLNRTMYEIEVEALPMDLPHTLTVDLVGLKELNQSLYVKDISVPKNVKVLVDSHTVVATVTPLLKEEEPAPAPVDVTAVKVESEEKKVEREKEQAAEEPKT